MAAAPEEVMEEAELQEETELQEAELQEAEEEENMKEGEEEAGGNEDEGEKNLDEFLDELKEDEEGTGNDGNEGDGDRASGDEVEDGDKGRENGDEEEGMLTGSDTMEGKDSKQEKEKKDREETEEEKKKHKDEEEEEEEKMAMDPSKGFLENEQDSMIAGSWKYRIKIAYFDFESRSLNPIIHRSIEQLVNISTSSAVYFYKKKKVTGKKCGKLELFCGSQTTGQLTIEKALRLDIRRSFCVFVMRKVNMEEKELAYIKISPRAARFMIFPVVRRSKSCDIPSTRSVYVSNILEGTSEELLQVLFPCCINIVKPEESEGSSTG